MNSKSLFFFYPVILFFLFSVPGKSQVAPSKGDAIRLVSYNVGVFSKFESGNYSTIANMMKELDADIVCMQELDSCAIRTDKVDQLKRFSGLMGNWSYAFGKAMSYQGGAYGCGVASKNKVLRKYVFPLPAGKEPRVVVVAEYAGYVVASIHLDHISESAQLLEVAELTKQMKALYGNTTKPVFLAGDMNAVPSSLTISKLKEDWTIVSSFHNTIPSSGATKRIDYVFVLNNHSVYTVVRKDQPSKFTTGNVATASDHLPIYIDFEIVPAANIIPIEDTLQDIYVQGRELIIDMEWGERCVSIFIPSGAMVYDSKITSPARISLPDTLTGLLCIRVCDHRGLRNKKIWLN